MDRTQFARVHFRFAISARAARIAAGDRAATVCGGAIWFLKYRITLV
jgi:hypothetical protein